MYFWINPNHSHPAIWEAFLPLKMRAQHMSCFNYFRALAKADRAAISLHLGIPVASERHQTIFSSSACFFSLNNPCNFHLLLFTMPLTLCLCPNSVILAFSAHFSLAESIIRNPKLVTPTLPFWM